MAYRPTDWHVLDLEGDPTPGDPVRVRQLSRSMHDFAEDVGNALRQISAMAGEDAVQKWSGKSAKKFKEQFDGVPGNLKKLRTSYDMAGDALAAYWPKLERAQALADRALAKGREARQDLTAAQSRLDSTNNWVKTATSKTKAYDDAKGPEAPDESKVRAATRNAQQANAAQSSAQGDVDSAQSALDAAKAMAEEARGLREDAANTCKNKLDEASDAGIQNRSWWEDAVNFVTENWDAIVAVCKVVVAVVGVIAMIVGGPILAAIVVVAALVVLADTLHKYANGKASLFDVGMAALDCIPGMKGLTTLAGAAKGIKSLAKGLRSGKGLVGEAKTIAARCKGGDPIDMISGEMLMEQTDLDLPGVLPLVLKRTHLSTYRWGQVFGESWASTLDQRLELDGEGAVFTTEDGMLLAYPLPQPGHPVMPKAGPRWPLEWDGTPNSGITISDPQSGLTRRFTPPPEIAGKGAPAAAPEQMTLPLQSITDRNANEITFEYDDAGMPTAVRHTGGYHIAVDTADDRIAGLRLLDTDTEGDGDGTQILRYSYDNDGNLTKIYNSSDRPLQLTYDDEARITSWTDRIGAWYRYTYDADDRVVQGEGVDGVLSCTITYDVENRTTRYRNSLGHSTTYEYNARLQLIAQTDPLGNTVRQEWDEHDRLLNRTDQLGNTTRYTYDAAGNITRITRPDGNTAKADYDELRRLVRAVDPGGAVWEHTYDDRGNHTSETDPAGSRTRYDYDERGRLTAVTDALDNETRVRCDAAGLPTEVVDPLRSVTRYDRDAFGRVTTMTDPLGAITRQEWTLEGKLAHRAAPDGAVESWTYDGEGNCTTHTGPTGAVTRFEHTNFDLLAARTDPDGARYEFAHDTELHLTQVTGPTGLTWDYIYDAAGRTVADSDFDDRTITYAHDAAGRVSARTTPVGDVIRFTRDTLGQVTEKDAAGVVTHYAYDPAGRLVRAANLDHELTLGYDTAGRLSTETTNGRTVKHSYDGLGRLVRRATPTGATTTYAYDPAGHRSELVTANGHTLAFTHDLSGRELLRTLNQGAVTIARTWGPAGRLARQQLSAGATTLRTRDYGYRVDGYLTSLSDSRSGDSNYTLDPAGRVTGVSADSWSETYAYDALGNQTAADWPETRAEAEARGERAYNGTLLNSAGSIRYEHDAAGRHTLRQKTRLSRKPDTWHYTWNAEDELTEVTTPDGARWRYTYDPLGRRTAKLRLAADGETVTEQTTFTWDGTTLIEQTTTNPELPHAVTLTWDHDGLHPIAQSERKIDAATQEEIDARFFAIATDLIGTPTELIDTSGKIAWHTRTTVWGTTTWSTNSTAYTPLRFPGQYFDPETGLHYNQHRYYDPTTARYLSPDPLGLEPAPNPVAYVGNPHTWFDPEGLAPGCGDLWMNPDKLPHHYMSLNNKGVMHADDFGVKGPYNKRNGQEFIDKIGQLVRHPETRRIDGTYRGEPATHYVDGSGLHASFASQGPNVGMYLGGWRSEGDQLAYLLRDGVL